MLANQTAEDAIAQNLANASTTGYKQDIPQFQSFADTLISRAGGGGGAVGSIGRGAALQALATDFEGGAMEKTGNPLDVALTGDACLSVQTPQGVRLSRDGALTRNPQGLLAQVSGGGVVLGSTGKPIRIPDEAGSITINANGILSVDGAAIGRIRLSSVSSASGAVKTGDNQFTEIASVPASAGSGLRQGYLESSNVSVVKEMVAMISCMRAYETNQKMVQAQDDLTNKAVNDVGKL